MSAGPSVIRKSKSARARSNLELVNSLRENFTAAKLDYATFPPQTNGHAPAPIPPAVEVWTDRTSNGFENGAGGDIFVPRIHWEGAALQDDASQYEITVKLFFLPPAATATAHDPASLAAERARYVEDALGLVTRELGVATIDLLVASFPGMSFEGTCEWEADKHNAQQGNLEDEVATWRVLEALQKQGCVRRLGVAEFGSEKLAAFIARAAVPPAVDQINLKDCCNVPPPLKQLAAQHGIELNVHADCTDILPPGTLRELLGHGPQGAGLLADPEYPGEPGLAGEIVPQWVVRYVAFVRDRGVIENKGYFAGAELVN
ncbi:NADP-dependent oxidoreductase domain protein [Cordyceps fumosorosea ARSEF 2679]|uniref:GCS light chain n=1 Tax=Cordyceps fumosorosea (strain ARSEF 2679) TaxID=1081104 RepID=A0A162MSC8_CORFA|nr:NADP-dependent oxidoreductase domain protein [Cordyceps fumosorosea ARSEF 2679]OAA69509.1 NADP-dependent oxidoreductase domain protein [Cordyceps fumosorosea ARSEF 2679]